MSIVGTFATANELNQPNLMKKTSNITIISFVNLSFEKIMIPKIIIINIYYCMTGRAIRGNIQFEAGSIGPSAARDNTEAEN